MHALQSTELSSQFERLMTCAQCGAKDAHYQCARCRLIRCAALLCARRIHDVCARSRAQVLLERMPAGSLEGSQETRTQHALSRCMMMTHTSRAQCDRFVVAKSEGNDTDAKRKELLAAIAAVTASSRGQQ
jgi:hypothetical protein